MLLHGRAEGHCFPARQQEGPTSVSAAPGAAPLKLEVSSPGESKAGWECPFGHCYGHCCSLPILYPLLTVNYIRIYHGLNNPVFKMGTMFPSAGARTVCWGIKDRFGSQRTHKRCMQPAEGARAKGCRWPAPAQCRQVGPSRCSSRILPSVLSRRKRLHKVDARTSNYSAINTAALHQQYDFPEYVIRSQTF